MSKPKVRAKTGARVTLTVELTNLGSWGLDCTIDQVCRQAQSAALNRMLRAFNDSKVGNIRVVRVDKCEVISTEVEVSQ